MSTQVAAPATFYPTNSSTPSQQYFGGGNGALTFSVKTTLIYIGGSLGVLALVIVVLMVVLVLCVRPTRRRQQLYLAMQRQRETGMQQVKAEVDTFKPQVRSFPIVILQPDSQEVACGKKISLDEGYNFHTTISGGVSKLETSSLSDLSEESSGSLSSSTTLEDVTNPRRDPSPTPASSSANGSERASSSPSNSDLGEEGAPSDTSARGSQGTPAAEEAPPIYNPLTHYLTERQPHLFVAEVER